MITAIYIVGAVFLLLLAACVALVRYVSVRHEQPDMTEPENLAASPYAALQDEIMQGVSWLRARPDVRQLYVQSYDGLRLHAQFVPCQAAKGTLLLFHGYRSCWAIDFGLSLPFYHAQGFNLLIVDERAHGESQGRYITFGVRERYDVLSWVTYLTQMLGAEHPLYLEGLSMGATTVLMSSCFDFPGNVRGILADCGFTSPYAIMKSVVKTRFSRLPAQPALALTGLATRLFAGFGLHEADTTAALAHTRYPVLFVHGKADTFVPYTMTQQAYDACASEKTLVLVENAEHGCSYLVDRARVQKALVDFLRQHLPKEEHI